MKIRFFIYKNMSETNRMSEEKKDLKVISFKSFKEETPILVRSFIYFNDCITFIFEQRGLFFHFPQSVLHLKSRQKFPKP